MNRRRTFALVAVLLGALLPVARDAAAWPVIDVVASQGGGPHPLVYTTSFTLSYAGSGDEYSKFGVGGTSGQIFECVAPPGWSCSNFTKSPTSSIFQWENGPPSPSPQTFAIVTIEPDPCVYFIFYDPFDENGVPTKSDDVEYQITACLVVDGPLPSRATTGGVVKSTYR